jgi:hypothetical protein
MRLHYVPRLYGRIWVYIYSLKDGVFKVHVPNAKTVLPPQKREFKCSVKVKTTSDMIVNIFTKETK